MYIAASLLMNEGEQIVNKMQLCIFQNIAVERKR